MAAASPGARGNGGNIAIESPEVTVIGGNSSILTRNFGTGRGGDIAIRTQRLRTEEGAGILTSTLGFGDGGNLMIDAFELVELSGNTIFEGEEIAGGLSADIVGFGVGGLITVKTDQLILKDGANISARTNNGPGGNIDIEAVDIQLLGGSIQTQTFGISNAGDITVRAQNLLILEGNEITASAGFRTRGNAGNIAITATESIVVEGTGGLITGVLGAAGDGGNITIETGELILRNGGTVSAQAITLGKGGNIEITADRIELIGGDNRFLFFPSQITTTTSSESGESAGDLGIRTRELRVVNGAEISVDTLGGNVAGNLVIIADDSIELIGSGVESSGEIRPSRISASTSQFGGGSGGDIQISTQDFLIADGAEVTVSSLGEGVAGNLRIESHHLELKNTSRIIGTSESGDGGNLDFQIADLLLLRNGSQISTNAGVSRSSGNGGNISIRTPFIIAVREENSDITANAFLGSGGSVEITARGIFGLEFRSETTPFSDITASSDFGTSGVVNLNTLDTGFIENNLTDLPQNLIDIEALISGACIARVDADQGSFVVTGNGGLPARPGDTMLSTYPTSDVQSVSETEAIWQPGDPIVEPTGAFPLTDGRLVLSRECD